ncbi:MAG: hypothetical protein H7Z37_04930 [Pyrinomonadaceae bacterium]|nr:hypothetical protein [Pyrinomonadaceae bacterium]
MQTVEIEDSMMAEICEAAKFEEKSCNEYIHRVLLEAIERTQLKRREPEAVKQYIESYEKFPQEIEISDEESQHWQKVYEKFEQDAR